MSAHSEPAIKSYFFGKGYSDLQRTIADSWRANLASAASFSKKVDFSKGIGEKLLGIMYIAAAASVMIFGTAFFLIASAVHVIVLVAFFSLIYFTFTVVYLSERLFLLIKGFSTVCPFCHDKRPLPEYYCDGAACTNLHRRLIPSSYGIFTHTCKCGQKLPATFFMNRGRLQARCASCERLVERGVTESQKLFIAVMGGPSVGKSCYLYSAIWKLIEEELPRRGFSHDFLESRNKSDYDRIRECFRQGRLPAKTTDKLPVAFTLILKDAKGASRLLYLYDPAGEAYSDEDNLVLHKYEGYLSGCIFLVDPFSIPYVRQSCPDAELKALKPGGLSLNDTLSKVLLSMEEHYGLKMNAQVKFPVAVVVSKVDAGGLDGQIGETAVDGCVRSSPTPLARSVARDAVLKRQPEHWGESGFVQRLGTRFARAEFFACSSLGQINERITAGFNPRSVLEPLLWILEQADRPMFADHATLTRVQVFADAIRKRKAALAFTGLAALVGCLLVMGYRFWPFASSSRVVAESQGPKAASHEAATAPGAPPSPPSQISNAPDSNSQRAAMPVQNGLVATAERVGLTSADGSLTLKSSVEGARIYVDGVQRGTAGATEREIHLSAGGHLLQAKREGYRDWERATNVVPNSSSRVFISMVLAEPTPRERALVQLKRAGDLLLQRQYDAALDACIEGLRWEPGNPDLRAKKNDIERVKQILNKPMSSPSRN